MLRSLVGSEMCIRDSSRTDLKPHTRQGALPPLPSGTSSGSSGVSEVLEVLAFLMFWSAFVCCFYVVSDRVVLGHLALPGSGDRSQQIAVRLRMAVPCVCRFEFARHDGVHSPWMSHTATRDCGNHNYAHRATCGNTHCPSLPFKPGDWRCPQCSNHNYAHRTVCNSALCKTPRP